MPIYDYECKKCGHRFEYLHKASADAAPACPECGAEDAAKMPTSFAVSKSPSFGGGQTCCGASDPSDVGSCAGPGSCCSTPRD